MKVLIIIFLLISPTLAQDNASPIVFDPGAVWANPADTYTEHHELPLILNPGMMIKAGNMMIGSEDESWQRNIALWLTNNSTNSSMFYA